MKSGDSHEWHLVKDPEGVQQNSPGREPWEKAVREESPARAEQTAPPLQGCVHLEHGNPRFTPWAVLLRPLRARSVLIIIFRRIIEDLPYLSGIRACPRNSHERPSVVYRIEDEAIYHSRIFDAPFSPC